MNVPIGVCLVGLALIYIPGERPTQRGSMDLGGAALVTAGLVTIAYAVNRTVDDGWTSPTNLGFAAVGGALLLAFVAVESSASSLLVPLSLFHRRTLTTASVVAALVFGSFLGFNFQLTLFMQQVLDYSAIEAGIAWLATSISAAVVGVAVAPRAVGRLGAGRSLVLAQGIAVGGLVWLSRTPADATYWSDLFPGMLAIGIAIGASGMAAQVVAFMGIDKTMAGLAGGVVEASREIGGALGTAVVATVVLGRSQDVLAGLGNGPQDRTSAVTEGVRRGAWVAAGVSLGAVLVAALVMRGAERRAQP